jgi:hypothetical protein
MGRWLLGRGTERLSALGHMYMREDGMGLRLRGREVGSGWESK